MTPRGDFAPGALHVRDGRIVYAGPPRRDGPEERIAGTAVPGLVDLQVNGFNRRDVREGTAGAIGEIAEALLAQGVTGWLPTIVSCDERTRLAALDGVAAHASDRKHRGARVLGVHLEGPWISAARAGAHDLANLERPNERALERSLDRHPGLVRLVTVAPEVEGGIDAVRQIVAAGAVASIGHSDASFAETLRAADAGARMTTHVFNAMRPLHHRDPGVAGATLVDQRLVAGLISDGVHVDPAVVLLAFRAKGAGRIALVSDVVGGRYSIDTSGPAARLADGTLAGALSGLGDGLAVAVGAGVLPTDAITAATLTPCELLGVPCGRLEPGAPADFVVLDDAWRPTETYLAGDRVWVRG